MPRSAVWLLAATAALLPHGAISSHVVGTQDQVVLADTDSVRNIQPTRKLNGKFLHITGTGLLFESVFNHHAGMTVRENSILTCP